MRQSRQLLRTIGFRDDIDDIVKHDTMTRAQHMKAVKDRYPRLGRKIDLMWGTQGMQDMFTKWLLTDNTNVHGQPRRGFPKDVRTSLMTLASVHQHEFKTESVAHWDWPADRWE